MSQLNVDTIKNRLGTAGPTVPSLTVTGTVTAGDFVDGSTNLLTEIENNKKRSTALAIIFGL